MNSIMNCIVIECDGKKRLVMSTGNSIKRQIGAFLRDVYSIDDSESDKKLTYKYIGDDALVLKGTFKFACITGTFEVVPITTC